MFFLPLKLQCQIFAKQRAQNWVHFPLKQEVPTSLSLFFPSFLFLSLYSGSYRFLYRSLSLFFSNGAECVSRVPKFLFSLFSSKLETPPDGKVTLFHPELMKKVESGEIGILEYDIFSSSINESFDLVRCMNLLNPLQFSDEQIYAQLERIYSKVIV